MADPSPDDLLREMAQHRGYKLVRSRRRKPGTGDYGKFGLTDSGGKPLLGIGENGLTASAQEIEDYLRSGTAQTWQQSASMTPAPPARKAAPKGEPTPELDDRAIRPNGRRSVAKTRDTAGPAQPADRPGRPSPPPLRTAAPDLAPSPPLLEVRRVKPADAEPLRVWLAASMKSETDLSPSLDQLVKARALSVAFRGELVGCCAWAAIPTLQHGLVGRIAWLKVDERVRRQGIGRRLLGLAEEALRAKGCVAIEVMSDIDIRNSHGFFRTLGFEQTSYRFAKVAATTKAEGG